MATAQKARREVEKRKQQAKPWVERLARLGYGAKGLVYFLVGILSLQAAFASGSAPGQKDALRSLLGQPFGQVILVITGIGLLGYTLWRFVQAVQDPENKGSDAEGLATRTGYVVSGIVYAVLAVYALQLVLGAGGGSGGSGGSAESLTARLLSQPFGKWLVMIVGIILIGTGFYQAYKGISAKFLELLKTYEMSETEKQWVTIAGRAGHIARSVIYFIIGSFLVRAGLQTQPEEAKGLGEALQTLAAQPYGPWLLGIVALGLLLYGLYAASLVKYRRIYIE